MSGFWSFPARRSICCSNTSSDKEAGAVLEFGDSRSGERWVLRKNRHAVTASGTGRIQRVRSAIIREAPAWGVARAMAAVRAANQGVGRSFGCACRSRSQTGSFSRSSSVCCGCSGFSIVFGPSGRGFKWVNTGTSGLFHDFSSNTYWSIGWRKPSSCRSLVG